MANDDEHMMESGKERLRMATGHIADDGIKRPPVAAIEKESLFGEKGFECGARQRGPVIVRGQDGRHKV